MPQRPLLFLPFLVLAAPATPVRAQRPSVSTVHITFTPVSDRFAAAARAYDSLWTAEGARIVRVMEDVAGLRFVSRQYADTAITARVLERASSSGFRDSVPMELRASYPTDTKKAALIHELGHRLQEGLFRRDEEEHGPLFLWLYDVWVRLYGQGFADAQVAVEKSRGGPYPKAWDDALALSAPERAAKWRAIRDARLATRR